MTYPPTRRANPYAQAGTAYRTAEITTLSQRDLIVRLYQGIERFLQAAIGHMQRSEHEGAHHQCQRAKAILNELLVTLDFERGGEIAEKLKDVYVFLIARVVESNLRKDPEMLAQTLPLVASLRGAWEQVAPEHADLQGDKATQRLAIDA